MERLDDDKWGREIYADGDGFVCIDRQSGAEFRIGGLPEPRARDVIESMLTEGIEVRESLSTLPDDGPSDAVLLVGGPLDGYVVDWPEPTRWQSFRAWFNTDIRAFYDEGATLKYIRDGHTATFAG